MTVQQLRDEAAKQRAAAESHYRHAQTCLGIEYPAWVACGDAAYLKAAELEKRADDLERKSA